MLCEYIFATMKRLRSCLSYFFTPEYQIGSNRAKDRTKRRSLAVRA